MIEKKQIEALKKDFEIIHEKFKATNHCPFSVAANEFVTDLCIAYEINDFDLNHAAIIAYRNVCKVLDERLEAKKEPSTSIAIRHLILVLHPFMEKFHIQAGRQYD